MTTTLGAINKVFKNIVFMLFWNREQGPILGVESQVVFNNWLNWIHSFFQEPKRARSKFLSTSVSDKVPFFIICSLINCILFKLYLIYDLVFIKKLYYLCTLFSYICIRQCIVVDTNFIYDLVFIKKTLCYLILLHMAHCTRLYLTLILFTIWSCINLSS